VLRRVGAVPVAERRQQRSFLDADPPEQGCGGLLVLAVACVAVSVVTFRSYQKNV